MPRQKGTNNKVEKVSFRLSPADKLYYTNMAKRLGYSFSQFILDRLSNTPIVNYEMERFKWDAVKELSKELNAIGNNINQLTKEVHLLAKGVGQYNGQYESLLTALDGYRASKDELINLISKEVL